MKKSRVQGSWGGASQHPNPNPERKTKPIETANTASNNGPVILQEGLVYFPNALSLDTQKWLIKMCMQVGRASDENGEGFYYYDEKKNGMLVLNQGNRGRVIRYLSPLLMIVTSFLTLSFDFASSFFLYLPTSLFIL
jgi:hypothetical protein